MQNNWGEGLRGGWSLHSRFKRTGLRLASKRYSLRLKILSEHFMFRNAGRPIPEAPSSSRTKSGLGHRSLSAVTAPVVTRQDTHVLHTKMAEPAPNQKSTRSHLTHVS